MIPLTLIALLLTLTATTHAQPARAPRKIVLLHLHDDAPFFDELGELTLSNKRRYATRHGYEVVSHTPYATHGLWSEVDCSSPGASSRGDKCYKPTGDFHMDYRAPTFGKIKLARRACVGRHGYWMLWSDADAMIVNHTVELETLIDDRYDMAVSVDWLMINAGVMLMKCSEWTLAFLQRVYDAREFDEARALDQSAFQHFFDNEPGTAEHVYYIPKRLINVYVEEYQPGDFLLHMAGKLYEATTAGATAIAHQFDILSYVDDVEDVASFFRGQYILSMYSGICKHGGRKARDSECKPDDERRLKLAEPLSYMSTPKRYKHVALRYYWMPDWKDEHDTERWDHGRKPFKPPKDKGEEGTQEEPEEEETHDEL